MYIFRTRDQKSQAGLGTPLKLPDIRDCVFLISSVKYRLDRRTTERYILVVNVMPYNQED